MKHLQLYNLEFIAQHKAFRKRLTDQGKSNSHVDGSSSIIKEFFHWLEANQVESFKKITQKVIDNYYHYLETRPNQKTGGGLSGLTIDKHGDAIMRYMEMLYNKQKGQSTYTFPFSKESSKEVEILSLDEIVQVYNATDNTRFGISNRMILSMLYGCGLRSNELATLELNDIDFQKREIRLDNTKTRYERDVPMSPAVVKYLEEYLYYGRNLLLPRQQDETFVMINLRGYQMSTQTIGKRVKYMMDEAGISKRIPPHSLRHSIGTHLLEDLTLEEIAEFLGHKSLDSTQIYTHLRETIA